jgi:hypothetical protein
VQAREDGLAPSLSVPSMPRPCQVLSAQLRCLAQRLEVLDVREGCS